MVDDQRRQRRRGELETAADLGDRFDRLTC
jgi:hypothetical protein